VEIMGHADLLAATVAALPMAVLALDPAGTILACNAIAARTFGCARESIGRPFSTLGAAHRVRGLRDAVTEALSGQFHGPFDTTDVSGADVTCRLAHVQSGDFDALLLIAEDRTDALAVAAQVRVLEDELEARRADMGTANAQLTAANEELQDANDALEARLLELRDALEINRHKDDFLAMLAHELRNPLAPILSAMQVIRRHSDNEDVVQRAREVVERQVRHQAQLLDDLLDVSRITRGRIRLRKASVDVRSAVSAALEATRPAIDARTHTLAVVLPDAPLRVDADPTRLTQIVTNLLDNAAKYTSPGGQIDLVVERDGGHVVLRVRDNGVGIPLDMQGRIFDVFTQVDVPIARSLGGLGLGLSLVRSLTELHGGTVAVTSDGPGRGSEFTIRLPLGHAEAAPGTAAPKPEGARHVLVIEDNTDAREMLRIALELDGHRVETAADGVSGVETALRVTPDLVLVDIGLPGLDGYAVAQRLRATLGDRVTLVALTGYGQSEDRRRTAEAGFDAHLVKPVDPDVLTRALASGFQTAA
jgi:signal transduction histidine kinase